MRGQYNQTGLRGTCVINIDNWSRFVSDRYWFVLPRRERIPYCVAHGAFSFSLADVPRALLLELGLILCKTVRQDAYGTFGDMVTI